MKILDPGNPEHFREFTCMLRHKLSTCIEEQPVYVHDAIAALERLSAQITTNRRPPNILEAYNTQTENLRIVEAWSLALATGRPIAYKPPSREIN